MKFDVRADVEGARQFFRELDKDGTNAAAANAINVVARTVRNESLQEVLAVRRVKSKSALRAAIVHTQRAKQTDLTAIVQASGRPITLKEYSPQQSAGGVSVDVMGQRKMIPRAFGPGLTGAARQRFTYTKNGKRYTVLEQKRPQVLGGHVFKRTGKGRLPIKQLFGPSFPSGFIRDSVQRNLRRVLERDWKRTFDEKIEAQLRILRAKQVVKLKGAP